VGQSLISEVTGIHESIMIFSVF